MKIEQFQLQADLSWITNKSQSPTRVDLVLAFGSRELLEQEIHFNALKTRFPSANIVSCSTAGEIYDKMVFDNTISCLAIEFEKTPIICKSIAVESTKDSFNVGVELVKAFPLTNLKHLLVLSDGHIINGTHLVRGIESNLPANVQVSGGLAGDAANFKKTVVGLNAPAQSGNVVAIGLYGNAIRVGLGCQGGWDPFGPEREITKSDENLLFELDNQSALDLYKNYLGDQAHSLPGSALLFPLAIKNPNSAQPHIMRTILSIDETNKSMTFAGNMPVGHRAQLMKANFDRLIDGASQAAETSLFPLQNSQPELALLISCVGRKLILNQRTDEEVEAVADTLKGTPFISGFYSYGEIAPFFGEIKCELHNQTMTITTLSEVL